MVLLGLLAPLFLSLSLVAPYYLFSFFRFNTDNTSLPTTNTIATNITTPIDTEQLQPTMAAEVSSRLNEAIANLTASLPSAPKFIQTTYGSFSDDFTAVYEVLASSPFFAILIGLILFMFTILVFINVNLIQTNNNLIQTTRAKAVADEKKDIEIATTLRKIATQERETRETIDRTVKKVDLQRNDIDKLHRTLEETLATFRQLSENRYMEREDVTRREENLQRGVEEMKNRLFLAEQTIVNTCKLLTNLKTNQTEFTKSVATHISEAETRIEELATSPAYRTPARRDENGKFCRPLHQTPIPIRRNDDAGSLSRSSLHTPSSVSSTKSLRRSIYTSANGAFRRTSLKRHSLDSNTTNGSETNRAAVDDAEDSDVSNSATAATSPTGLDHEEGPHVEINEEGLRSLEFSEETSRILEQIEKGCSPLGRHLITPPVSAEESRVSSPQLEDETFETF